MFLILSLSTELCEVILFLIVSLSTKIVQSDSLFTDLCSLILSVAIELYRVILCLQRCVE